MDKSFEYEVETNEEGLMSHKVSCHAHGEGLKSSQDVDEIAVKVLEEYKKSVPEYQQIMSSFIVLPMLRQEDEGQDNHDSLIQTQKEKVMVCFV